MILNEVTFVYYKKNTYGFLVGIPIQGLVLLGTFKDFLKLI
jgi:tetrahydromethanopterin S-methyltransferase subunit B